MPASSFDDVLIVNPRRVVRSSAAEVEQAQELLGVQLPSGYVEFVRRLGTGSLGHFVRVMAPTQLHEATLDWRERIDEFWFWETSTAGLEPEGIRQAGILLADSFDGDELFFVGGSPDRCYVLPRNDEVVFQAGPGFLEALGWMLAGTVLNSWVEEWTFEAPDHRAELRYPTGRNTPQRSLDDACAALEALNLHNHRVDIDVLDRRTYFLPGVAGRLSLYAFEGEAMSMDFAYDDEADDTEVARIVAAVQGNEDSPRAPSALDP